MIISTSNNTVCSNSKCLQKKQVIAEKSFQSCFSLQGNILYYSHAKKIFKKLKLVNDSNIS